MNDKKIQIVDVETACVLLGCTRANIYGYYLKNNLLSPVPRIGKKAYFLYSEVNSILNEKLADLAARKNMKLTEANMDNYKLVTDEFKNNYTELTHKN
jgi:hypothetical protein